MTLRHIKIFVTVCETNNITAAAEKLYLSQPAVSLAIKELEQFYGVKLFDRISRKLFLTDTGKNLLDYAVPFLSLYDEMENKISNRDNIGSIRIGASITIGTCYMPGIVKEFCEKYPGCDVRVFINSSDEIEDKLLKCELDFAIIEGIVHSKNLTSEKVCEDELAPVVSGKHHFATETEIPLTEFMSERFLLREIGSGARELFDNTVTSLGYRITPEWESTSTAALLHAVSKGLGVSVLSRKLVERGMENYDLHRITVTGLQFKRQFSMIHHQNKYLSDMLRVCMDLCKERISENHLKSND
jgi:Transcriptional regulator